MDLLAQLDNPLEPKQKGTPINVGPVVGYNRSLHSADISSFAAEDAPCPVFQNGSANGFFVGANVEIPLDGVKNSKQSIIARVLYNSMPASFEQEGLENERGGYPSKAVTPEGRDTLVYSTTRHANEITYNMVTLEAQYKLNFIEDIPLGVIVGPTFDLALARDQDQTMQLLTPANARFLEADANPGQYRDDGRTFVAAEGEIENSNAFRFGIKFGLQYEINLQGFFVVPSFNYNFGITNLSADDDWRVSALQFGVDVRFPL